jgi:hypothetical protein
MHIGATGGNLVTGNRKQRGQARLPNPELIRIEFERTDWKAFKIKPIKELGSLKVRKAGLPPLLSTRKHNPSVN